MSGRRFDIKTDQEAINLIIGLAAVVNVEQWEQDFITQYGPASGDTGLPIVDETAAAIRKLQEIGRAIAKAIQ